MGNKIAIFFLKLLSRLPLSVLYIFSYFLYFIFYKLIGYRKKTIISNLKIAFPQKSENEINVLTKKYYKYLSHLVVEIIKGFTISADELNKRIKTENSEIYDKITLDKSSAIVVMGHNGNWEWVCRQAPLYIKTPICVAYKPLSNPYFDDLFNKARTEFGTLVEPMAKIGKFIIENKNKSYLIILTADQSPSNPETGIWAKFFNIDTSFLSGLEKLSLKYNLPIIFHEVKMTRKGYYHCTVHPPILAADLKENQSITQYYANMLEQKIMEQPEIWLWSHKRWKHKKQ